MPKRVIYGLPDALRAEGYSNIPEAREISLALARGRIPCIERDEIGRLFFNDADLSKIAMALGLKPPEKPGQPTADTSAPTIDSVFQNLDKLFK